MARALMMQRVRVTSVGKGSSEPKDPNNPEANRRTEFVIL